MSIKRTIEEWDAFCKQIQEATIVNITETPEEIDRRKKKALADYSFFVQHYFPNYADAPCAYFHLDAANKILKDPNIFFVAEWPREHAKTVHMCLMIPMWLFIHKQVDGLILMSRNEDIASNALGDIQAFFQFNQRFIQDWGAHFNFGNWSNGDFSTKDGIRFLALGRDQAPQGARKEGKRPNIAICSDLDDYEIVQNEKRVLKVVDTIRGALYPALAIKGSRMIIEGNRIHPRSIVAHMVGDITPTSPKNPGIVHSKVFATESRKGVKAYIEEGGKPAWKERYTVEELRRKFQNTGIVKTKAEYYHEHSIEGRIFKNEYIHFRKLPPLKRFTVIIGYFDPSFENNATSDYKAVNIWGLLGSEKWCIKRFVRKTTLMSAFAWMSEQEDTLPTGVSIIWYVEEQFFNQPIRDALSEHNTLRAAAGRPLLRLIMDSRHKENKYTRMVRMEPDYCNNKVFYNEAEIYSPDMIEGNNQLKGIEPGYKGPDDSPDADEGAWHYIDMHKPERNFEPIIRPVKKSTLW